MKISATKKIDSREVNFFLVVSTYIRNVLLYLHTLMLSHVLNLCTYFFLPLYVNAEERWFWADTHLTTLLEFQQLHETMWSRGKAIRMWSLLNSWHLSIKLFKRFTTKASLRKRHADSVTGIQVDKMWISDLFYDHCWRAFHGVVVHCSSVQSGNNALIVLVEKNR